MPPLAAKRAATAPLRRVLLGISLALPLALPLPAQSRIKASSCLAADSLLGPLTPPQRKVSVSADYNPFRDTTYFSSVSGGNVAVGVIATVRGQTPVFFRPPAQLWIMVPYYLIERDNAREVSAFVQIDDSPRMSLGPAAIAPLARGTSPPQEMPIRAELTPDQFLALARGHKLAASWFGKRFTLAPDDLDAVNAMYRLMLCAKIPAAQ